MAVKLEMAEQTGGLTSLHLTFLLVSVVLVGILLLTRQVKDTAQSNLDLWEIFPMLQAVFIQREK